MSDPIPRGPWVAHARAIRKWIIQDLHAEMVDLWQGYDLDWVDEMTAHLVPTTVEEVVAIVRGQATTES